MSALPRPPRKGWRLRRPQGSAIIVALLAVALVAGLATTALGRADAAIDLVEGRQAHLQARVLARDAIEVARQLLADDAAHSRIDWHGETWARPLQPALYPDARIELRIEDAGGRFDLNALAPARSAAAEAGAQFAALALALGADAGTAARALSAIQAHLLAHGPVVHADALRTIAGLPPALAEALEPVVTALPRRARLNINTAPAAMLAAALPGLGPEAARVLERDLRKQGAEKPAELAMLLPDGVLLPDLRRIDVRSDHFLAEARAVHGVATVRLQALLTRQDELVSVVWLRLL